MFKEPSLITATGRQREPSDIGVVLGCDRVVFLYYLSCGESNDALEQSEALMCVLALPSLLNVNKLFVVFSY